MPVSSREALGKQLLVKKLADVILGLHSAGIRDRRVYSEMLLGFLEAHPRILCAWTVWEPDALDGRDVEYANTIGHDSTGRFVHSWHRAEGSPMLIPAICYETPEEGHWYLIPKLRRVTCRLEPAYYPFGSVIEWITTDISPILIEGLFYGAVGIDFRETSRSPITIRPGRDSLSHSRTMPIGHEPLENLSPRERGVFHWLGQGKTNEEIGIILGISHHTVKNHLERIYQKLGVNNRCEAVLSSL